MILHGSMLSHAFPCSSTTAIYQDDKKLIKPCIPLLEGQEAIAPPNLIYLSCDFKRSPSFGYRYTNLSINRSIKKNEMMSMLLSSEIAELDWDLLSNSDWFPNLFHLSNCRNSSHQPIVDYAGDTPQSSNIMFLNNDKVLSRVNANDIKEYIGTLSDMYRFKRFELGKPKTYIVPTQHRFNDAKGNVAAAEIVPFPLSPGKMKSTKLGRKKGKRTLNGERDVHKRSYLHSCESLLTLVMGANQRHDNGSVVTAVKSAPEIPALLTQMSACIAGAGLAVLFFAVAWMVNTSDVSRCVSIGLGLGLVWVAWAVIKLRDAIALVGKSSGESVADVGRKLREIYFGVGVLMTLAVMKVG